MEKNRTEQITQIWANTSLDMTPVSAVNQLCSGRTGKVSRCVCVCCVSAGADGEDACEIWRAGRTNETEVMVRFQVVLTVFIVNESMSVLVIPHL